MNAGTPWLRRAAPASLALLLYALLLYAHGLLPGVLADAPSAYFAEGQIRCLNDLGLDALTSWCHDFGEPLGAPVLTGGPVVALGTLLMWLPGVGSHGAYLLAGAAIEAAALAGGYGLMRRLGADRVVAICTAAVYLLSPTALGLTGFGGTFFGFLLLPAYAWADLVAMDALERRRGAGLAVVVALYTALKTAALFMDGYSFVAGSLVSAALWGAWLVRRDTPGRLRVAGLAVWLGASAAALGAYELYVPGGYGQNPIEIFRAMGLDLATLAVPTVWIWPASELGIAGDHQFLWGDPTNSAFNYVGAVCLALAILYLARSPRRRPAVALAAAGAVALVLSFGPSLKIDEVRPDQVSSTLYEAYLMPKGVAAVDLPWGGLYTRVPGVDQMRATHRWFGVTRMALIVLAGLAVARLARGPGRRWLLAAALGLVAAVELMPNLPLYEDVHRHHARTVHRFADAVDAPLTAATSAGERAFFLSYDGSHIDYLANYLAAGADLRAYNAGGDKNATLAFAHWSPEVFGLTNGSPSPEAVAAALESGAVDVVIAPYFHLRLSAYGWPPDTEVRTAARTAFAPLMGDSRFQVRRYAWFATIRLRGALRDEDEL